MKAVFKPTKKKVVIIVLVLVVIIGAVSYFNAKAKAALAAAEPMYNTAAVEKKDLKKKSVSMVRSEVWTKSRS